MSVNILIAEDEDNIRRLVAYYLSQEGFRVTEARGGAEALSLFREQSGWDLVILDVMMPAPDGYAVCREIRSQSDLPILMLTARDTEQDEVTGFHCGADEYIAKPFSPAILTTRVKNLLRRSGGQSQQNIVLGETKILARERVVMQQQRQIILTPKEFDLLCYLARNRNLVLTRQQILDRVWGADYDGDDRTVDTHIKCLRAKLVTEDLRIITLRKVGYKLEADT